MLLVKAAPITPPNPSTTNSLKYSHALGGISTIVVNTMQQHDICQIPWGISTSMV